MGLLEVLLIGVGLSMDAFAVSVCKGLSVPKVKAKHVLAVGLYFGGFQALMPIIGYYLGASFHSLIQAYDHWVAFGLLLLIGANMIKGAFDKREAHDDRFSPSAMIVLAVATSIDALAVGISFAMIGGAGIYLSAALIGATTFALSCAGITIGNAFGAKFQCKAQFAGGFILILIGLRILMTDLGIL